MRNEASASALEAKWKHATHEGVGLIEVARVMMKRAGILKSLIKRVILVGSLGSLAACASLSEPKAPAIAATAPIAAPCVPGGACANPLPVKVVVVTMFEIGEDSGDAPGEFQLWRERRGLNTRIPFPHSHHDLYYNPDTQILGMVTGMGTAKSTAATMALGLDQRFDLSHAYWLVAGIAGIDPEDASIGSVAWASYLVDGDLAHEIDAREIPKGWDTGYFALDTKKPYDPKRAPAKGEVFVANPALRDWAFNLTKDVALADSDSLKHMREQYKGYPMAQKPPFVLKGDTLSAMTFWHGALMNKWADRWVDYWSDGKGEFVTSAMEDTGTYQSIDYLGKIGRVDPKRVMVLRSGSNFTMPPPGVTAVKNLLSENEGYSGMQPALEGLYSVGSVVIDELLAHWDKYEKQLPAE